MLCSPRSRDPGGGKQGGTDASHQAVSCLAVAVLLAVPSTRQARVGGLGFFVICHAAADGRKAERARGRACVDEAFTVGR